MSSNEYSISLDKIERIMGEDFYRCHPKYLINVAMIKDIDTLHFEAVMHDKVRCPIELSKYLGLLVVIGRRVERSMNERLLLRGVFKCLTISMLDDFDAWRFSGIPKESPVCLRLKDKRFFTINRNIILYVEKKFRYLDLRTKDESYMLQNMPLNKLVEILGDDFVQCHRRFVVNIMYSKLVDKSWMKSWC